MNSVYLNSLYKFQNKWVAVDNKRTKVIAAADSINSLTKKIKKTREKNIIFSYILPENRTYSPTWH